MREIGSFRWFIQYGFETDVFDVYREAVRRSNRQSIQVLSVVGAVTSLITIAYGLTTRQPTEGLWFCAAVVIASVLAGAVLEGFGSAVLLSACSLGFAVTALLLLMNKAVRGL